ncbi:F-box protein At3g56470-like [Prunus avium]|uniref:F-box protein At3g56470-like n=1 Tax=Prunus avium TaxID=42229 RepID=A0A6P5SB70_PRUAV|nr:F-box protein At3g56470-like [Prunus avium]
MRKKVCMESRPPLPLFDLLPPELLSKIADGLSLIDLLSFRSVCKAWNSASSTASAQNESSYEPWFLLYEEHSDQCQLLICESGKTYTISNIPELKGATCLASNQGWLLLFKPSCGSIFFFCPFSRAKIDLPKLPASQLCEHVAAFSSPPTCQDCIVSVISRINDLELELNVLHRGGNEWIRHQRNFTPWPVNRIECGAFHNGEFYFFACGGDRLIQVAVTAASNLQWQCFSILPVSAVSAPPPAEDEIVSLRDEMGYLDKKNVKQQLGMGRDVSISTCGTQIRVLDGQDRVVFNENGSIVSAEQSSSSKTKSPDFKGIWIHPIFCQISPIHQSW